MKKLLSALLAVVLSAGAFAGCGNTGSSSSSSSSATDSASGSSSSAELKEITIGASPTPHALILQEANKILETKGYTLKIQEFSEYALQNMALEDKSLDANYFQHQPYLDKFNAEQKTTLVSAGSVHYEPFGIYAGKTKSLDDLKDGATISVPNDTSNEARALLLLQAQGLIKLKEDSGITATQKDIVENPKNLKFAEIDAAQLVRSLADVDLAVINGNYALQGDLKVADALAAEASDSLAASTYANIVAVREGDENRDDIKALIEVLQSDEIKKFITDSFEGAVVPVK